MFEQLKKIHPGLSDEDIYDMAMNVAINDNDLFALREIEDNLTDDMFINNFLCACESSSYRVLEWYFSTIASKDISRKVYLPAAYDLAQHQCDKELRILLDKHFSVPSFLDHIGRVSFYAFVLMVIASAISAFMI